MLVVSFSDIEPTHQTFGNMKVTMKLTDGRGAAPLSHNFSDTYSHPFCLTNMYVAPQRHGAACWLYLYAGAWQGVLHPRPGRGLNLGKECEHGQTYNLCLPG